MNLFDNFPDSEIMNTLGNPVVYHQSDTLSFNVYGVFNNPFADAKMDINMAINAPTIECLEVDLPGLSLAGQFTINGVQYRIVSIQPDGTGLVLIELQQVLS